MRFYQTIAQSSLCPVVMVICSRGVGHEAVPIRDRAKVLTMDEARRVAFLSSPCSLRNIVRPYAICCASFEVIAELVTLSAFIPKGQGDLA